MPLDGASSATTIRSCITDTERGQISLCMKALREGLPGFQTRKAQLQMIAAVANALGECRAEADSGTTSANIAVFDILPGLKAGDSYGPQAWH